MPRGLLSVDLGLSSQGYSVLCDLLRRGIRGLGAWSQQICIYIYIYIYMYTYIYICMHMYIHTYICTHI